jgi:XTP/dITP diphosphohydrolase
MISHLIVGTTNPAKIYQVRGALHGLNITVEGMPKDIQLPHVEEDGGSAEENARKKAKAYSALVSDPVIAIDNALYFDNLPPELQPGLNVRRIPGHTGRPTDTDLLNYFSKLIGEHGGTMRGHWDFACALADKNGVVKEITIQSYRTFVSKACTTMTPGFPLDSLQIDETGTYLSEMDPVERAALREKEFGEKFRKFIAEIK